MTSPLKKLLVDCFETSADGAKTGLLAARATSTTYFLHPSAQTSSKILSRHDKRGLTTHLLAR